MGLLGGLFGGGGGATKAGKKAASELVDLGKDLYNQPVVPYGGQLSTGLSDAQKSGIALAQSNVGTGQGALSTAAGIAQNAAGYTPQQLATPSWQASLMGTPANMQGATVAGVDPMTGARIDPGAGAPVVAGDFLSGDVSKYMDPYVKQVIEASMSDIQRQRAIQGNMDKAAAAKAGAYGGTRQAVQAAETTGNYDRTAASTIAGLYSNGFNQATGLMTSDMNRRLAAEQGNQSLDYNRAAANAGYQQQANAANYGTVTGNANTNAQYQQAANTANYGAALDIGKANAGFQNAAAESNAGLGLEAGRLNQAAGLAGNQQAIDASRVMGGVGQSQADVAAKQAEQVLQAGTIDQATQQAALDAQYQEWLRQQNLPLQKYGLLTGATGIIAGQNTNTSKGIVPGIAGLMGGG